MQQLINSTYEHHLAYYLHQVDNRGLLIDQHKKSLAREACEQELSQNCTELTNLTGFKVYIGRENAPEDGDPQAINLNAPKQVLGHLKFMGFDVPRIRKKNEETDEYELKESAGELALQIILSDATRWPSADGGKLISLLLKNREIITFRNRYLNAKLWRGIYYCNSNVAATVTGRRGTKKNIFGFGGNDQNFPARGRLSDLWKECVIARPGYIFFIVDQVSAEDWPVQALAQNTVALDEMRRGVNRHYNFASQIFNVPVADLKFLRSDKNPNKDSRDDAEMKYYFGKKGRHANNYGMQPKRLSESLAAEGYSVALDMCKNILTIVDRIDPNVKRIFHQYIQAELSKPTHSLTAPLGRERQFFGLRSGEKNYAIFNEAYAWIPQSTIGDNTGLAICELESSNGYCVQESHDSICQECPDTESTLLGVFQRTKKAFTRTIRFHNGIEIDIPIEGTLSYNWKDKVKIESFTEEGVLKAYKELKEKCDKSATMITA